jgi:hypothetical protein
METKRAATNLGYRDAKLDARRIRRARRKAGQTWLRRSMMTALWLVVGILFGLPLLAAVLTIIWFWIQ